MKRSRQLSSLHDEHSMTCTMHVHTKRLTSRKTDANVIYIYGYEIIYLSIKIHINVYTTLCRVLDCMRVLHLKCIPYIH